MEKCLIVVTSEYIFDMDNMNVGFLLKCNMSLNKTVELFSYKPSLV